MPDNTKTVNTESPLPIKASMIQDVQSLGKALRAANSRPLIIREASDLGFSSDEVVVVKGDADTKNPDQVIHSTLTPVVSQKGFVQIMKRIREN